MRCRSPPAGTTCDAAGAEPPSKRNDFKRRWSTRRCARCVFLLPLTSAVRYLALPPQTPRAAHCRRVCLGTQQVGRWNLGTGTEQDGAADHRCCLRLIARTFIAQTVWFSRTPEQRSFLGCAGGTSNIELIGTGTRGNDYSTLRAGAMITK